jgi:hypothetical protein
MQVAGCRLQVESSQGGKKPSTFNFQLSTCNGFPNSGGKLTQDVGGKASASLHWLISRAFCHSPGKWRGG